MSRTPTVVNQGFWIGLLVVVICALLAVRSLQPPVPSPIDAPASDFSGLRAAEVLDHLLGNEAPHPVGSAANQAVRDRLLDTLAGLGLSAQVQRTVGCSSKHAICANVENVLVEIPGETDDALVLMAHYDSVPHAPGAADDGSGVVTLIESARALALEAPHRNRLIFLFTDAEEMGLLGAEAFFAEHPSVSAVKAVINVEGSGSGGPSLLLRSSSPGGHLLRAYQETASTANAYSYSQEVFARMPNDTDFTVPDRQGIASIDFAFAFEFNHYHTPLDTLANLDKGTLQHHGENVLPLARRLAGLDLGVTADNFSYLTIEQSLWITWPVGWTVGITLLGITGLLVSAFMLRSELPARDLPLGFLLALAALVLGAAACFAGLWVARLITGTTVSFPASAWPFRLILMSGALMPVSMLIWRSGKHVSGWARFMGSWLILGLTALAIAITAPLAANLLAVPLLVAALLALLAAFLLDGSDPRVPLAVSLLAVAPLAYCLFAMAYAMEETQGYGLAPAIYVYLVLIALALLPLAADARPALGLAATMLVAWMGVAISPLYSDWRPQHLSFYYVLDRDNDRAWISTINANPLPDSVSNALGDTLAYEPITPWSRGTAPTAAAPVAVLPDFTAQAVREGERVLITVRSEGDGDFAQLILPAGAGISEFSMAGKPMVLTERNNHLQARFFANGNEPLVFAFSTSATEPVEAYLVDGSHTLPVAVGHISRARGTLAVPRHQGDQRLAFQRIQF